METKLFACKIKYASEEAPRTCRNILAKTEAEARKLAESRHPEAHSIGLLEINLTQAQIGAAMEVHLNLLREVKARLGRSWRTDIHSAWMNGNYRSFGLEDLAGRLQQLRNVSWGGPAWLHRVKL